VRYIGCSNFAAWQLMKSLSVSERHSLNRYVVYQGYYSLVGRDYESELMPLMLDQGVGLMVWSALGWGRLTGRIKRGQPLPEGRIQSGGASGGPDVDDAMLYDVLDVLDALSTETGKSVPQLAINWLLQRPTVSNVIIGARNEQQLIDNLSATGWKLTEDQVARLDKVSSVKLMYPHWVGAR
jgi:aryl-alcohol dehydrogenase-like predicted oxidoreductase